MTKLGYNTDAKPHSLEEAREAPESHVTTKYPTNGKPSPKKSGWRCCIGLTLISIGLLAGVVITVALVRRSKSSTCAVQPETQSMQQDDPFTFDDIFDPELRPRSWDGHWVGDGNVLHYRNSEGAVMQHDAETGAETVYMDNSSFTKLNTGTYYESPDLQYVLMPYERESVWRWSYNARYKIHIIGASPGEQLIDFPHGALAGEILQYARWGASGNALAFVYGNNLYVQDSPTSDPVQITTNGEENKIRNGIPDWLYEEDVLEAAKAHYWSPSNSHLCYATFDVTSVQSIRFPWYGPKSDIYGDIVDIAYPKPGALEPDGSLGPNTEVQLRVASMSDPQGEHWLLPVPVELQGGDYYYYTVEWPDSDHLMITWANRAQFRGILMLCDVSSTTCVKNYDIEETGGWIEMPAPRFIEGGASYVTVLPKEVEGSNTRWRHAALITADMTGEGQVTFLTDGEEEVKSIVGYDDEHKFVYYLSTAGDPTERHLFRVGTPDADPDDQVPVCLTCGDECRYLSAPFSGTGKYFIYQCSGPDIRTYSLRGIEDSTDVVFEDNADVKARLEEKLLPSRTFMEIDVGGGFTGTAELFIPPNHVPGNKYKLFVYTYAGPGSQRVFKTFPMGSNTNNWLRHLASEHNILVASVDGRGSSGRGDAMKFDVYRRLGVVEIQSQIEAGEFFKTLDNVDEDAKAAIYGWSYGGFTTSHVMGDESTTYECGVAVAPVTSYRYYDTAYTERYMAFATADDNAAGYDNTDVMDKIEHFTGKKFFLAHGSADDNVHYQQSAQLIKSLSRAEHSFRQMTYIYEDHGIGGASRHLYRAMTDFLLEDCWEMQ